MQAEATRGRHRAEGATGSQPGKPVQKAEIIVTSPVRPNVTKKLQSGVDQGSGHNSVFKQPRPDL